MKMYRALNQTVPNAERFFCRSDGDASPKEILAFYHQNEGIPVGAPFPGHVNAICVDVWVRPITKRTWEILVEFATVLWLSGQHRGERDDGCVWDFQGIFTTRERAVHACRNENYFIAPILVDYAVPDASVPFSDAYYPLAKTTPEN
jgi:hypothetical protein